MKEHDNVITQLLRGAPRLGLAFGPVPARAGPGVGYQRLFGTPKVFQLTVEIVKNDDPPFLRASKVL